MVSADLEVKKEENRNLKASFEAAKALMSEPSPGETEGSHVR